MLPLNTSSITVPSSSPRLLTTRRGPFFLKPLYGDHPMTTAVRTNIDGQPRKTLASQLDRLDGILDGLDAALAGAVQDAVEQAVKQAVQAVLTEVLTNRELQEQLQQAAQHTPPPEKPQGKPSLANRLWHATIEGVQRTVQK